MLSLMTEDGARFVGLRAGVLYRIELGFAVVDDGERLFRIKQAPFEHVVGPADAADGARNELVSLVEGHPSVFELFADRSQAEASVREKEI